MHDKLIHFILAALAAQQAQAVVSLQDSGSHAGQVAIISRESSRERQLHILY